ncbi:LytTR family transcriptional regulator [Bacteroidales bacterium OttesenSCG-928-L14]|nr:LytTR family transcriptional regulator [Bacteroidales bacterium OttesenSCG-928-L14]
MMKGFIQQVFKKLTITLISIILGFGSLWLLLVLYADLSVGSALLLALLYFVFISVILLLNLIIWKTNKTVLLENSEYNQEDLDTQDLSLRSEMIEKESKPLERISIKQASEITILKIEEIFHLEAYGDYVLIFTDKGKYIKEQTMKYFETNLPSQFIRIHRSYIVNTDHIIRLEQYGKENYNIRLKNGTCLKASISGYKLLKEYLSL